MNPDYPSSSFPTKRPLIMAFVFEDANKTTMWTPEGPTENTAEAVAVALEKVSDDIAHKISRVLVARNNPAEGSAAVSIHEVSIYDVKRVTKLQVTA